MVLCVLWQARDGGGGGGGGGGQRAACERRRENKHEIREGKKISRKRKRE